MKYKFLFFVVCFFAAVPGWGQIITTVAGDGNRSGAAFYGDGGPAIDCNLFYPYSTALDGEGNLYIADSRHYCIRMVNTSGIITTVAGCDTDGYSGDGGQATNAKLSLTCAVTVASSGNIYISDFNNNRIREVNSAGIISTIAGTGVAGFSGDNGYATSAELSGPAGIVIDDENNIYISEQNNNRIRKINASGIISTIAGTGVAGYTGDGMSATDAELNQPVGIALDKTGNIYFTEYNNNCVREISTSGIITTFAGCGILGYSGDDSAATVAKLKDPTGVAVDGNGNVYIADVYNERVREVNTDGIITTIAGTGTGVYNGDGVPATDANMDAVGITVDSKGSLYIADFANNRIRYVSNTVSLKVISKTYGMLRIYPNPSQGQFNVEITSGTNEDAQVVITNELGQKVKELKVATNQAFPVSMDVPDGLYFLTAHVNNEIVSKKIEIVR